MGLYAIDCPSCGKPFQWFSGNMDQRCDECKTTQQPAEAREWWIDPNENPGFEGCAIRSYDALDKHPGQGDLLWQSQLVHVIEKSAYDALKAKLQIAREALEKIASCMPIIDGDCPTLASEALKRLDGGE